MPGGLAYSVTQLEHSIHWVPPHCMKGDDRLLSTPTGAGGKGKNGHEFHHKIGGLCSKKKCHITLKYFLMYRGLGRQNLVTLNP